MKSNSSAGASAYVSALQGAGVTHFVTVPDFVQLALHQAIEAGDSSMTLMRTCNEDQAVSVAAGLTIAGKRPVIAIQNQGFYACINTVRAVALDARIPTLLLIGQFGREAVNFDQSSTQSSRRVVNLLEPLLTTLGVPFWGIDGEGDLTSVQTAMDAALAQRGPAALIVERPITWN